MAKKGAPLPAWLVAANTGQRLAAEETMRQRRPPGNPFVGVVGSEEGVHSHVDEVTRDALLVGTRIVAERINAALVMRWRALRRVTFNPAAVRVIAAALVLTHFELTHDRGSVRDLARERFT